MSQYFKVLMLMLLMVIIIGCASGNGLVAVDEADIITGIERENEAGVLQVDWVDINDLKVSDERPHVEIDIDGHGLIVVELFPEYAPITVDNFLKLVEDGFYNGLSFHRIIPGFMMQGGGLEGTAAGGSAENIVGEFLANGIGNPIRHTRGVLSMARMMHDYNSASSQFFIMHADTPDLDADYAAFGRVIEGIEVVDSVINSVTSNLDGDFDEDQPIMREVKIVN